MHTVMMALVSPPFKYLILFPFLLIRVRVGFSHVDLVWSHLFNLVITSVPPFASYYTRLCLNGFTLDFQLAFVLSCVLHMVFCFPRSLFSSGEGGSV